MVARQDTPQDQPAKDQETPGKKSVGTPKISPQDTEGWLTREESARFLGVAVQTVVSYEKRQFLHPAQQLRRSGGREYLATVYDTRELVVIRAKLTTPKSVPETDTWVTRHVACESLSVSAQTLKNYEERNILHPRKVPRKDSRGHEQLVVVYDPKELQKLPRGLGRTFSPRDPGELEAQCYQLIEEGKSDREIVMALRITSDRARDMREQWQLGGGSELMVTTEAKAALETMLGPFKDVTDLVVLVTKLRERP